MKRWLRRLAYFFLFLLWLLIMVFPTFAFVLAMQEQIQLGSNPRNHLRFFLVREEEADGIGLEWARPLLGKENCNKTSVVYLLWEGGNRGQNVSFCQCYDPATETPLPVAPDSCQ